MCLYCKPGSPSPPAPLPASEARGVQAPRPRWAQTSEVVGGFVPTLHLAPTHRQVRCVISFMNDAKRAVGKVFVIVLLLYSIAMTSAMLGDPDPSVDVYLTNSGSVPIEVRVPIGSKVRLIPGETKMVREDEWKLAQIDAFVWTGNKPGRQVPRKSNRRVQQGGCGKRINEYHLAW